MSDSHSSTTVSAAGAENTQSYPPLPTNFVWPRSLVIGTVTLLVVLFFFMMMELPMYVHNPRISWAQIGAFTVPELLVVGIGVTIEVHSTRYFEPSLDRPVRWFLRHLRHLPVVILVFVAATAVLRYLAFASLGTGSPYPVIWGSVVYEGIKISVLFCCWLAWVFAVLSFVRMRQQAEHLLSVQKTLAEAKLTQLKAQLRPHFLFNTLNTISSFMQVDVARADRLLTSLGDLLRANLDASDRDRVPLREELELLRRYADIMLERFSERVAMEWRVADDALEVLVPTMLLQPLLENAFKHGVEKNSAAQSIQISVAVKAARLSIAIRNTGSQLVELRGEGRGLRNCRERLQLLYGAEATLELDQTSDGVEVSVLLPCGVKT